MSSSSSRTISRPRRNRAWSSAISTRIGSGPRPASGRGAAGTAASPLALNSLPPCGATIRLLPTDGHDASRAFSELARLAPCQPRWTVGLLFRSPDNPVVVAATAVDHAEPVTLAVVEQEEVVTHEFHLEQGLVDRHRPGGVHLLAQHQRAVALHLDRDHGAVRFGRVERVVPVVQLAGARPGRAVAIDRGQRSRGGLVRDQGGRAQRHVVVLVDLAAVRGPAEAGFEFGEGEIQRRVPVVGGRLGPDRGAAGPDGQFDAFTPVRLPRVAFLGDLHVDPHRLLVKLLELGELGGGVLTETRRDGYVASADDDFHHDPPSSPIAPNLVNPAALAQGPIGLFSIEPGGTRPADLVFDPTFAC